MVKDVGVLKDNIGRALQASADNARRFESLGGTLDKIENKIKNLDKMEKDNSRNAISKIEENSDRLSENRARLDKLSQRGASCGYKNTWSTASSVITYEKLLLSKGDAGTLNLATGVWTTNVAGFYQVSW